MKVLVRQVEDRTIHFGYEDLSGAPQRLAGFSRYAILSGSSDQVLRQAQDELSD
jgi:hypothetical protein